MNLSQRRRPGNVGLGAVSVPGNVKFMQTTPSPKPVLPSQNFSSSLCFLLQFTHLCNLIAAPYETPYDYQPSGYHRNHVPGSLFPHPDMALTTNGVVNYTPSETTNGGASSEDGSVAALWARYEHLKYSDVMKNVLVEVRAALQ